MVAARPARVTWRKLFSPGGLLIAGGVLAVITFLILWLAPSDDYLWLPDRARPVAPLVTVAGPKAGGGSDGIYFVDLIQRRATLLESVFPGIRGGSTLIPGSQVNPRGVSEETRQHADLRAMARSQEIAAAVALRRLGYHVGMRNSGALVVAVLTGGPSLGKLSPGDVIVGVDGGLVRTTTDLRRRIGRHHPNEPLTLSLRDARGIRRVRLRTTADPHDASRPIIGVLVQDAVQIKQLPIDVKIDTGNIGGPSAGLAFALDVMEKLGRDVDHGHRVAATGELFPDGSVGEIGGIKQKTIGARSAGVDVFLVPAENAAEARANADGLRVIAVRSLDQALRALATLPAER